MPENFSAYMNANWNWLSIPAETMVITILVVVAARFAVWAVRK